VQIFTPRLIVKAVPTNIILNKNKYYGMDAYTGTKIKRKDETETRKR
jgi:hypothetical protein